MLGLLTLPELPRSGIPGATHEILEPRPCFAQEWIAEGEAVVTLSQLTAAALP